MQSGVSGLPSAASVVGRAKLVPVSEGLLNEIPPAVTYFPTQSPKQYRRR